MPHGVVVGRRGRGRDIVGVRLTGARARCVLRRACEAIATATTSSAPRSPRAHGSRWCRRSFRASRCRRAPRSCRSTTSFAGSRTSRARPGPRARSCVSSASRDRPARRRPRISWPRCSRRSAATRAPRRTTTSSGCRSRCSTRRPTRASSSPRWASGSPATSPRCARSRSPTIGVVTNVGLAHAEHLGGAEGAAR